MEAHIRRNELLTVFQSGFCRHDSTTAAVLKVTEDIRSNMEDGQLTVLVLLDFSQAFDMVVHGLLLLLFKLRNPQNYSDGAQMLVDSYLNGRTQFVRCGEKESFCLSHLELTVTGTLLVNNARIQLLSFSYKILYEINKQKMS
jgi:hypothetical protein